MWENNLYAHAQNVTPPINQCDLRICMYICKVYCIRVLAMGDNLSSSIIGDSLSSFVSENSESVPGPSSAVKNEFWEQ